MAYATPFPREEAAERLFSKGLLEPDSDLMLVGRQFEVFGGPERLDLLALDRDAIPWVFEFKRGVAKEDAIGQLLSYGAFVAPLSCGHLAEMFSRQHKQPLREAFRSHFRKDLPEQLSGRVQMVLAAFGFSDRCNRTIIFLEKGSGLVIGEMSVKLITSLSHGRQIQFKIIRQPKPSLPIFTPIGEVQPEEYFLLSVKESELYNAWDECRDRNIVTLTDGQVQRHRALRRAAGLFVYIRSRGLVGYGVVTKAGKLQKHSDSIPPIRADVPQPSTCVWRAQVQWQKTHPWYEAVRPMNFWPSDSGLFQITNPEQLQDYRVSLGI